MIPPWPMYGITMRAPNAHAVVYGDKRLENRGKAVAGLAKKICGQRIAITCSARLTLGDARAAAGELGTITHEQLLEDAGKMIGSARIVDVLPPEQAASMPGHKAGSWGIVLDDVEALAEPAPATGALDIWRAWTCACGRFLAVGHRCRDCMQKARADADRETDANRATIAALPTDHPPIHRTVENNGRDFRIPCLDVWSTAKWNGSTTALEGVYRADTGDLYAFARSLVTCTACLDTYKPGDLP